MEAFFMEHVSRWWTQPLVNLSSFCWLFVGCSAIVADFVGYVRKTVWECVALGLVSMGCFSRAFYVFVRQETDRDALWISVALALYCLTMWYKYIHVIPNRPDYKPPPKSPVY